ncbi:OBCAM [Mytilus edulis]|uniref:OPCML n=1 Tax=Mytilus edulis TaxID=6550 RepID=A0A8S3TSR6_MYTED|nr:OBCAM [Mytilus edulis]
MKKSCEIISILVWIYCYTFTTAEEMVNYKYFSEGETVILQSSFAAKGAVWVGPAHNSSNPSPVIADDPFGKQHTWMTTQYTNNRVINPAIPNFRRIKVVGLEPHFRFEISNASLCDQGFYRCFMDPVNSNHPFMRSYVLLLKKWPSNLTIENETDYNTIIGIENKILQLSCNVEGGIPPETIIWRRHGLILQIGGPQRNVYELIPNRGDHNSYLTCEVMTVLTKKSLTKTVRLEIKYKPKVFISKEPTMSVIEGTKQKLCCENIDSRISTSECLQLESLTREDSGNYTCVAGNEIGNGSFTTSLVVFSPPVFVAENKKIQYGKIGKPMDITVKVFSTSKIKCLHLNTMGSLTIKDILKKTVLLKMNFHGVNITAIGTEVQFRLVKLQSFGWFNISVCNTFAMTYFILEVKQSAKYSSEEKAISLEGIVIIVLLILIVILMIVMGTYVRYLKQRYRKRMITTASVQTADEVAHYIEIVEVNNELATLHEQNNQMISTDARRIVENRNISVEQLVAFSNNDNETSEHARTLPDNESHTSEHLDDGYERPYMTLVAQNYVEEEHVYNNTKSNSLNDNSTPLQNPTCRRFVEITEQDATQDNTDTHVFAADSQENVKQNTGEYINLSIKQ